MRVLQRKMEEGCDAYITPDGSEGSTLLDERRSASGWPKAPAPTSCR